MARGSKMAFREHLMGSSAGLPGVADERLAVAQRISPDSVQRFAVDFIELIHASQSVKPNAQDNARLNELFDAFEALADEMRVMSERIKRFQTETGF